MPRIAFVNGRYGPASAPVLPIEDRSVQFADAVYEVWPVRDARLWDAAAHFERLRRSLIALEIQIPMTDGALQAVLYEIVRRNAVRNGHVYLQISRGCAPRDHAFPKSAAPSVIAIAKPIDLAAVERRRATGIKVVSAPDERWARCDIKTTGLLANVLARQAAVELGATEAWLVDDQGRVSEGASSTAWIVDKTGIVRTRPADRAILNGVTRLAVLDAARALGLDVEEAAFGLDDVLAAREAFATSAGLSVTGVVALDGRTIGDGRPGPVTNALHLAYDSRARRDAGAFAQPLRRVGVRRKPRYRSDSGVTCVWADGGIGDVERKEAEPARHFSEHGS